MVNPGIYQSWSLCWPGASPRCNTTRTHRIDHDVDHLVDHNLYLVVYDTLCTIRIVQFRPRKQNMCYCRPHHPQIIRQHELSIGQLDHVTWVIYRPGRSCGPEIDLSDALRHRSIDIWHAWHVNTWSCMYVSLIESGTLKLHYLGVSIVLRHLLGVIYLPRSLWPVCIILYTYLGRKISAGTRCAGCRRVQKN